MDGCRLGCSIHSHRCHSKYRLIERSRGWDANYEQTTGVPHMCYVQMGANAFVLVVHTHTLVLVLEPNAWCNSWSILSKLHIILAQDWRILASCIGFLLPVSITSAGVDNQHKKVSIPYSGKIWLAIYLATARFLAFGEFYIWRIALKLWCNHWLHLLKWTTVPYNVRKSIAAFAAIMLTERFGRPLSANTSAASGRWPIRRTHQ